MNHSVVDLVLMASPVVQIIMGILALMSLMSWAIGLAKSYQLRKARKAADAFEDLFWRTPELTQLYNQANANINTPNACSDIFIAGFKEFVRLKQQGVEEVSDLVSGTERAMRVAFTKHQNQTEHNLSLLATIGSSAPYIGLLGTVWGVMDAFASLGSLPNATLEAVAPGISEALIATALGLFAAIPAVIAYNRLTNKADKLLTQYENFAEGFLTIIQREAHSVNKSANRV